MAVFHNADGLAVRYGREEGVNKGAGEYRVSGPFHITEVVLELADLPSTQAAGAGIISDTVSIPSGAFIERVTAQVTVETAGTNANLDFGLIDQDRTTELDFNGFIAAGDAFNAGTDIGNTAANFTDYVPGATEGGALLGTVLTNTGLLSASYDTAAFTAGTLVLRVYWSKTPTKTDAIP